MWCLKLWFQAWGCFILVFPGRVEYICTLLKLLQWFRATDRDKLCDGNQLWGNLCFAGLGINARDCDQAELLRHRFLYLAVCWPRTHHCPYAWDCPLDHHLHYLCCYDMSHFHLFCWFHLHYLLSSYCLVLGSHMLASPAEKAIFSHPNFKKS